MYKYMYICIYIESVMLTSSEIKERNEIKDLIQSDVRKLYKSMHSLTIN